MEIMLLLKFNKLRKNCVHHPSQALLKCFSCDACRYYVPIA